MKYKITLIVSFWFFISCTSSIDDLVKESSLNFNITEINKIYNNNPNRKLYIDKLVVKYWGGRIRNADFIQLEQLRLKNNLVILNEKIEKRKLYLTSEIFQKLKRTDISNLRKFIVKNPHLEEVFNYFISEFILPNLENYTYNELLDLESCTKIYDDSKKILEFELAIREEKILNTIVNFSFVELNNYYKDNPGNEIVINYFLESYVLPTIQDYDYFELKQIIPLIKFSCIVNEIEVIKSEKRRIILSDINMALQSRINDENKVYLNYKVSLKNEVDEYFYPGYEKFCEEYFDFGSDLYRTYATVADFLTSGNRVEEDYVEDWNKFIDNSKIDDIINEYGGNFNDYLNSDRLGTRNEVSTLFVNQCQNEEIVEDYSITKKERVNFQKGKEISQSLASKNTLTEAGNITIDVAAGIFTGGFSLFFTRGASMVGSASISISNEGNAEKKYRNMYEQSLQSIFHKYDSIFYGKQKKFNMKIKKEIDEKL
ncbi:hypothetical protein [Gillisia sp. JM1]|uniref:hypothetical protein n=1 Tax=Gillisia sp. JM1 TaxID=1283286 RepID=UPI0003F8EB38|nr:hypothetical protein [Gillisia sp. JM1]